MIPVIHTTRTRPFQAGEVRLAFAELNLRRNPFGVPEDEAWADLFEGDAEALLAPLREGAVLQLLGDAGRGKSTHLRGMLASAPDASFVYVAQGEVPPAPASRVVLIDEAQRLPPRWLAENIHPDQMLALGTHEDLGREIARLGRPTVVVRLRGLDRARLRRIVDRRIAWARRSDGPVPTLSDEALDTLIAEHGDDLRAIEARLYDVFQDLRGIEVVTIPRRAPRP